ncbi:MAG: hypothetical protein K0R82_1171 [Flavipsychrobacter sp.]|nr:hypothetical protein [Flavipsychrobacter sp.]
MKTFTLYLVILCCLLQGCASMDTEQTPTTRTVDTTASFPEKIAIIEQDVSNLEETGDLDYSSTYVEIFDSPEEYYSSALDFIADPARSLQQKQIAAYAMSNIELNKYVALANTAYQAFKAGTAAEDLLAQLVYYQYPSPSNKIVVNYKDPEVVKLLSTIKTEGKVSADFQKTIDEILSGKLLQLHKATP